MPSLEMLLVREQLLVIGRMTALLLIPILMQTTIKIQLKTIAVKKFLEAKIIRERIVKEAQLLGLLLLKTASMRRVVTSKSCSS